MHISKTRLNVHHTLKNSQRLAEKIGMDMLMATSVHATCQYKILHSFQIIGHLGFSRYIVLRCIYTQLRCSFLHSFLRCIYISRCIAKPMYLENPKQPIIWDGVSWFEQKKEQPYFANKVLMFMNCMFEINQASIAKQSNIVIQ